MKRFRTGILITILVSALGILGGSVIASVPAYASSGHEVCDQVTLPPILCENAWNEGPSIKTYTAAVANNNMLVQGLARCSSNDLTTTNCPISGNPTGLFIYQIKYVGPGSFNGDCIGEMNESGNATLVACNDPNTGFGGGLGTIQVSLPSTSCDQGGNESINAHFTNANGGNWSTRVGTDWNNTVGSPVILNGSFFLCLTYTPFG